MVATTRNKKESMRCLWCRASSRNRLVARAVSQLYRCGCVAELVKNPTFRFSKKDVLRGAGGRADPQPHEAVASLRLLRTLGGGAERRVRQGRCVARTSSGSPSPTIRSTSSFTSPCLSTSTTPALPSLSALVCSVPADGWCSRCRCVTTTHPRRVRGSLRRAPGDPMFHVNPLRDEGSLVVTDFGLDLAERLDAIGFHTETQITHYGRSQMSHCAVFSCRLSTEGPWEAGALEAAEGRVAAKRYLDELVGASARQGRGK